MNTFRYEGKKIADMLKDDAMQEIIKNIARHVDIEKRPTCRIEIVGYWIPPAPEPAKAEDDDKHGPWWIDDKGTQIFVTNRKGKKKNTWEYCEFETNREDAHWLMNKLNGVETQ